MEAISRSLNWRKRISRWRARSLWLYLPGSGWIKKSILVALLTLLFNFCKITSIGLISNTLRRRSSLQLDEVFNLSLKFWQDATFSEVSSCFCHLSWAHSCRSKLADCVDIGLFVIPRTLILMWVLCLSSFLARVLIPNNRILFMLLFLLNLMWWILL